ncbi:hypothetical protein [Oryzifoliimicrobium ureilyticus]
MYRNARRARAIAIAKVKDDNKLLMARALMIATGAMAALLALLLANPG